MHDQNNNNSLSLKPVGNFGCNFLCAINHLSYPVAVAVVAVVAHLIMIQYLQSTLFPF